MQEQDSFQHAHQTFQPRKSKNNYTLLKFIMINQSILTLYLRTSKCGEFVILMGKLSRKIVINFTNISGILKEAIPST